MRLRDEGEFQTLGLTATVNRAPTLVFLADEKYLEQLLANPCISCVVTTNNIADKLPAERAFGVLLSDEPKFDFFSLHNHLFANTDFYGSPKPNMIDPSARIHPMAWIDDHDVVIGPRTQIGPHSAIYANTKIGRDCRIGAGNVIGADGFECFRHGTEMISVLHAGGVSIGDCVDIHNNSCVDRALFKDDTRIGSHSRVDNLVHIAHNAVIGERSFIVADAMVAGRVTIGDDVWIGPCAALRNGYSVADGAFVSMGAVVTRNVEAGQMVSGNFAIEHSRFIRFMKSI
jgi:UDP-3-O-[3-hydroxymyristoyl] glucosamine N-acyltransferase